MKPKKLNLQEILKIYSLLSVDGETLDEIVEHTSPEALLECVSILYDNKVRFNSPLEFLEILGKGLVDNDFQEFLNFIKVFKHGVS